MCANCCSVSEAIFTNKIGVNHICHCFLQLLEPGRYIWLLKALYGLLMLLPQQSAAFKILRTRLKTVPAYSFSGDQLSRTSSGNPYFQSSYSRGGSQNSIDVNFSEDSNDMHSGINFSSRLQLFEHVQYMHRMHSKSRGSYSRSSSNSSTKNTNSVQELQRPEDSKQPVPTPDLNGPSSKSSRKGP
nr:protein VAC14 homolog isoform X1 [Ipomoea batatas]